MNRGWGVEGCWHIWGWIIVSFQTCTICMFGSGLEPLHSSHTELLGWEVGSPRHPRFSVAYNNGPHSGSTTHLALSDKWFWKRTHTIQHAIHVPKQMTVVTQFCFFGGNVFWPFAEIYTVLVTDPGPKASHMCLTKKRIYGIFDRLLIEPPVNKSTITLLQFCLGVQY